MQQKRAERVKADETALNEFLASNQGKGLKAPLTATLSLLKHEQKLTSVAVMTKALNLIRIFVAGQRYEDPTYMMIIVRAVGRRLSQARPFESVIPNAVRRVLFLIREECQTMLQSTSSDLTNILEEFLQFNMEAKKDIRPAVIDAVNELLEELENLHEPISKQALEHIQSNEIILVYGYSSTLLQFLLFAKSHDREFEVYVMESTPHADSGHFMASQLSKNGINATLVPDTAAHVLMPRISKVFISPKCILATGSVLAPSGTNLLSLSAQFHRIPFVCVAGLHKLTPEYIPNVGGSSVLGAAGDVCRGLDLSDIAIGKNVKVFQSNFDVIESERISLLLTNTGSHQTTYVYRLLREYYHEDDKL